MSSNSPAPHWLCYQEQLPFSIHPLDDEKSTPHTSSLLNDDDIQSLLPASFRIGEGGNDITASSSDVAACLKTDLDLHRLHMVWRWIWIVGRPMPPRPLHHQLLLSRAIFLTERMDMHLIWTTGRIFLKPIPRYLLEPRFWTSYLASPEPCSCFREDIDPQSVTGNITAAKNDNGTAKKCYGGLRMCALGFLFSYAALIKNESDFHIAKEKRLLPEAVTWVSWITIVKQLDTANIYDKIDERFKYGELRLSRLNKIYRFTRRPLFLAPYVSYWTQYESFFQANFAWLASTTLYIVLVLAAMQVGLTGDKLNNNRSFQSASFGFTIFSILVPLVAALFIFVAFLVLFVYNLVATLQFRKERSRRVQLRQPASGKTRSPMTNACP